MLIPCPHCGTRPVEEFTFLGDATPIRPQTTEPASMLLWDAYMHERDNPRGKIAEYVQHSSGCRAWLVVMRNTETHAVDTAVIARDFKRKQKS